MSKAPFFAVYYNKSGELIDLLSGQVVNPADIVPHMKPFNGVFLDAQGNMHDISDFINGGGSPGDGGDLVIDNHTLIFRNRVLAVNTATEISQDNTRPITAAGVYKEIGNIQALLEAI